MNSLVKALIQPLLEAIQEGIALVPGGFKPPTVGHFSLVDEVAKNPNVDKVIVLIGHKNRDGVSKEESLAIWDIYKKYLPSNVEIKISDNSSPISDVGSLIKNNPQNMYYPVVGMRGEMDLGDLKRFDSMKGKYDNFKPLVISSEPSDNRISGTNTRAALIGGEKERFQSYLPTELTDEEREKVWSILQKTPLDEIYTEPSKFSYPPMIKSLTEYMLDKGMNIRPLPKVKFVDDDVENAQNFFGKTAYYSPTENVIVLYTMGRHPKDVMRSYAHEMIHHMQNCDGRLQNITTQNTNEEGDLPEIEREAYEKGNMTFRNWTDTLTEGENKSFHLNEYNNPDLQESKNIFKTILKDGETIYLELKYSMQERDYTSLSVIAYDSNNNKIGAAYFNSDETDKKMVISAADTSIKDTWRRKGVASSIYDLIRKQGYKIVPSKSQSDDGVKFTDKYFKQNEINSSTKLKSNIINEGRYDKITNEISSAIFKYWKQDIDNGAEASRFEESFEFGDEEISIDANISVVPGLGKLNVDGGADDTEDYIQVRFEIDPKKLPKFWEEISMNLKDVIRHEIEHLTHGEGFVANPAKTMEDDMFIRQMIDMEMLPRADYFKLEKEIDANLKGMYLRAKKEKRPFGDVIDTYLDAQNITPEQKEEILDLWRRRLPALNLPKF